MLDNLPIELYFNILSFVPLQTIQTIIPQINKHSYDIAQTNNEQFWKYICEHKYYFQENVKPVKQSWKDFSSDLGVWCDW